MLYLQRFLLIECSFFIVLFFISLRI